MKKLFSILSILLLIVSVTSIAQSEKLDMGMVNKIKKEGLENSKVMDIALHLTDISGPRLTASPGYMRAATLGKKQISRMGFVKC